MESQLPVTFLAVLAVALAGCTGTPAEPVGSTDAPPPVVGPGNNGTSPNLTEPPANATPPFVERYEGSTFGVGVQGVGSVAPGSGEHVWSFEVQEGATAIVIEAAWEGPDQMDLLTDAPGECTPGSPAGPPYTCPGPDDTDGSSPAKLLIVDPELLAMTGEWTFGLWARQSTADVPFQAAVTVFYGEVPTDAYTALVPVEG